MKSMRRPRGSSSARPQGAPAAVSAGRPPMRTAPSDESFLLAACAR